MIHGCAGGELGGAMAERKKAARHSENRRAIFFFA